MFFADLIAVLSHDGFHGWRRDTGRFGDQWFWRGKHDLARQMPCSTGDQGAIVDAQSQRRAYADSRCDELAGNGPDHSRVVDLAGRRAVSCQVETRKYDLPGDPA